MPKGDLVRGIDLATPTATFTGAGAGSVGASGMEVHDLDGPWHSGDLPWASVDKTGSSLADLATRAHSSLTGIGADDHHNQSHVLATTSGLGADHTTSGLTAGYVLRASGATTAAFAAIQDADLPATIVRTSRQINSGAGLTGGGNLGADLTLNVGAGTLITVNANDVALQSGSAQYQVPVTGAAGTYTPAWAALSDFAGAGLAFTAGAFVVGQGAGITVNANDVALTTPGTLTVATSNSSSGSHTHAITSSSNPGANAVLLASTGSGGLTLQALTVAGNVDITSGGDLTVGANILFVDVSQVSVGINGAPDPQFALDVYGPARAEYWIGPHALQIKNALLISHFDGRQPFETNFTGETNGHMGQVATVAGGTMYREGKFNKAVQVAPATTNLLTNPSFETGLTGWTLNNASGTCTAAQTALYNHSGAYSVRLHNTTAGANDFYYINVTGLALSTPYTISAWYRAVTFTSGAVGNYGLVAYDVDNQGATIQTTTITAATDGWVRKTVTVTTTATGGSHSIQIRLYAPSGFTAWDSVQVEQKTFATPYCDGSLGGFSAAGVADGTGHSWAGTAHASTSSRLAGSLAYATTGSLGLYSGTVAAWINLAGLSTSDMHILRATGTSAGNILLRVTTAGLLQGYWGTGAVTGATVLVPGTWYHVAMTYDGATVRLYINGQSEASGASTGFSGMPTLMYAGNTGGTGQLNGLLDDLLITSDCKVADEILAIYESNAPVFAETAKYGFRTTSIGLIWADDEGLWGRNVSGQPIIGLYGGEAATKSWAGLTLASGDFVVGDSSRGGYLLWDDSAATLVLSGAVKTFSGSTQYAGLDNAFGLSFLRSNPTGTLDFFENPERQVSWHSALPATTANMTTLVGSILDDDGADDYNYGILQSFGNGATGTVHAGLYLVAQTDPPDTNPLTGSWAGFHITAHRSNGAVITTGADYFRVNNTTDNALFSIYQTATTRTEPVLALSQADVSEEFINFIGTVAAGNAINTTALGAYYGRVRVSVNGTFKWLALYS